MTDFDPTLDPDEVLTRRIAEALGYDLALLFDGEPDCGEKCPCCQLDDLVKLFKAEKERWYRKGWQRVMDQETPAVPDLIFDEQNEIANVPPPRP